MFKLNKHIATGISGVVTLSTFIGLPVNIPLGAASLTGASVSGIISALTKKYQKKLTKITKLTDITSAIAVFERVVSKSLKDCKIDEEELNLLQTFHLKTMNELTRYRLQNGIRKQEPIRKSLLEEINKIKKNLGVRV